MVATRRIVVATVMAMLVAACGDGGALFTDRTAGDTIVDADGLTGAAVAPEFLVIDEDPASPAARAYSHYRQNHQMLREWLPFEDALERESATTAEGGLSALIHGYLVDDR